MNYPNHFMVGVEEESNTLELKVAVQLNDIRFNFGVDSAYLLSELLQDTCSKIEQMRQKLMVDSTESYDAGYENGK